MEGWGEMGVEGMLVNAQLVVGPDGRVERRYAKHFLYETDETWAEAGREGFLGGLESPWLPSGVTYGLGICMDINPCEFKAPFDAYELATAHKARGTRLILFSSAWTHLKDDTRAMDDPRATASYWAARLAPLLGTGAVFVCADRVGAEGDVEFVGSSCVIELAERQRCVGLMGTRNEGVLVCACDVSALPP